MALFKDGVADDLSRTISVDNHEPKKILKMPNVDLLPAISTKNNGDIFYDAAAKKMFVILDGVAEEVATV